MPDVAGGGTTNVTVYDEDGRHTTLLSGLPVGSEWALPIRNVNPFNTIRTPEESRARAGAAFTAGTGRIELTAAGNIRGTLTNPSGSGKSLYVYRIAVFSSTVVGYARMRINPTVGLPTTLRAANNNFIGHPNAAVGVMRADASVTEALGGGADSGLELALPAGTVREIALAPFILPPGLVLGLAIPLAGATTITCNIYWWEE